MKKIFEIDGRAYTFESEEKVNIDFYLDKKDKIRYNNNISYKRR